MELDAQDTKARAEVDVVMEEIKKGRSSRRRKLNEEITPQVREQIQKLITDMETAAADDEESLLVGQPAVSKIHLLPTVITEASKVNLQAEFIHSNILLAIKKWLSPSADGTLPNVTLRDGLLKLLTQLPIDTSHLKDSEVGKVVMQLWKHPDEIPKNKKTSQELIEKWSRPLFKLSTSYAEAYEEPRESGVQRPKEQESVLDAYLSKRAKPTIRARIPVKPNLDFVKKPTWDINAKVVQKSEQHARLEKRTKSLKLSSASPKGSRKIITAIL